MKRGFSVLLSFGLAVACTDGVPTPQPMDLEPSLGVEPSPFFPVATNELNAVENHLLNIDARLVMAIENPPDPYRPTVNKLEAMDGELNLLTGRVDLVLAGVPVDEIPPVEFKTALTTVKGAASEIGWKAGFEPCPFVPLPGLASEGGEIVTLGVEPSPFFPEEACEPLGQVSLSAMRIVQRIVSWESGGQCSGDKICTPGCCIPGVCGDICGS